MRCPFCSHEDTRVVDSRGQDDYTSIRRRRICDLCNKRFTTFERIDVIPLTVIKRDGTRELFDRNKLLGGIMKSCNKRPITMTAIEEVVSSIEARLVGNQREIESKDIGVMVMERLKGLDEVSYVRFASVYREFKDIGTFMDELTKMMIEKKD